MDLDDLQRHWNEWGRRDPYWAIISRPDRRGNRWDLDEFLRTGVDEIDELLAWLRGAATSPSRPGRALDFGCGVGRLTQALARTFAECDGVDIAPSMIERAERAEPVRRPRATTTSTTATISSLFADGVFDLIYSDIVLQHIAPEFSARVRARVHTRARARRRRGVPAAEPPARRPTRRASASRRSPTTPSAPRSFPPTTTLEIEAGAISTIAVDVRNTSTAPWPDDRFVTPRQPLARAPTATMLRVDDGRASDGRRRWSPATRSTSTLEMQAPTEPGAYLLELDLVIEGVAWFADRGFADRRRSRCRSCRAPPRPKMPKHRVVPVMEIHGIPRAERRGDAARQRPRHRHGARDRQGRGLARLLVHRGEAPTRGTAPPARCRDLFTGADAEHQRGFSRPAMPIGLAEHAARRRRRGSARRRTRDTRPSARNIR